LQRRQQAGRKIVDAYRLPSWSNAAASAITCAERLRSDSTKLSATIALPNLLVMAFAKGEDAAREAAICEDCCAPAMRPAGSPLSLT
jgi:hypothetical protein